MAERKIRLVRRIDKIKLQHVGNRGPKGIQGIQGIQGDPATNIVQSVNGKIGTVVLDKQDVGLGNVNNTSDSAKPISTATQTALNTKVDKVAGKGLSTEDYTTAEKTKLSGVATGATANDTDANLKNRANHTGTQSSSTISDFNTAADARVSSGISTHVAASDPHAQYQKESEKGSANGYAELDATGKVPSGQLPSFVDDVIEVANYAALPATGETGKIYVVLDNNITYRWSGSAYVEISSSLALGETSTTAYRGDRGKTAYDHTLNTNNPHGVTKAQVGLGNVSNLSPADMPVSTATQTALDGKANFPDTDSHVPVRDGSGAQSSLRYTSGTTGYTIGFRTADGQIGVGAPTDNTHATNKGYVDTALNAKANASDTVNLTGNQTVAGVKTFSSSPVVPTATTGTQAVNKGQMDTALDGKRNIVATPARVYSVDGAGNQSSMTFSNTPASGNLAQWTPDGNMRTGTPVSTNDATPKSYVDAADALKVNKAGDTMTGVLNTVSVFPTSSLASNIGSTSLRYASIWAQRMNVNANSYFDGATGGYIDAVAPSGIRINGIGYITGTGFPNGVVSAPVGSKYIDTASTSNTIEYVKAAGTGNTGWQIVPKSTTTANITVSATEPTNPVIGDLWVIA